MSGLTTRDQFMSPEHIYEIRSKLDLTQTEMATLVGTDQRRISHWERGVTSPTHLDHLLALIQAEKDAGLSPEREYISAETRERLKAL